MFTLMVIACDRFFAIMFPMKSRVTRRKVSIVLIAVWIAAIAIASPLLFIYSFLERHWADVYETYCDEIWPMKRTSDGSCDYGQASKQAYWILVCGVLNWTPMICMMMAYTFIVVKLRNHKIVPKLGASAKSTIQQKSKRRVSIHSRMFDASLLDWLHKVKTGLPLSLVDPIAIQVVMSFYSGVRAGGH